MVKVRLCSTKQILIQGMRQKGTMLITYPQAFTKSLQQPLFPKEKVITSIENFHVTQCNKNKTY